MENSTMKFNFVETENIIKIFDILEKNFSKKYILTRTKHNLNQFYSFDNHNCKIILPKINYKKTFNCFKGKIKKNFSTQKGFLTKL